MEQKKRTGVCCIIVLLMCNQLTVYACEWKWQSKTYPYELIPVLLIGAIIVEALLIKYILHIENIRAVLLSVGLGNIVPYAITYIWEHVLQGYDQSESVILPMTFREYLQIFPSYIVSVRFVLITIFTEFPIVYFGLRKFITDKKKGWIVMIGVNVVSVLIVYLLERRLCFGTYTE